MTKKDTIQKSYGEYWEIVKNYVDENGWIETGTLLKGIAIDFEIFNIDFETRYEEIPFGVFKETREYVRPILILEIENNSGWIKIENQDSLPKSEIEYFVKRKNVAGIFIRQFVISHTKSWIKCYTHYQPIIKPREPLY